MSPRAILEHDVVRWLRTELARRTGHRVVSVERRPHPYRTSFPLEEVDVVLDDGARVAMVFKDLRFDGLDRRARQAKDSRHDPRREMEAYRLLEGAGLDTPRLFGETSAPGEDRHWLLIERIPGVPLWQIGNWRVWRAAAAWLATMHRRFRRLKPRPGSSMLLYDGAWARDAMRRALQHASGQSRKTLLDVESGFRPVVDWLDRVPTTLVHGDFHASNVLVDVTRTPPRIAPADWELAGIGPGLLDLASLTAGRWSAPDRDAVVSAYASSAHRAIDGEFLADLERCRLLNALSLLAVGPDWRSPPEHQHDWLGVATTAAERLGVI